MQQMPGNSQARRLYDTFAELSRRYQHRDVNIAAYRGLTVSQTHVLEFLDRDGTSTMGAVAAELYKSLSAVTRMVDPLVRTGLVKRQFDQRDRRVCNIAITPRGRATIEAIRDDLAVEYGGVLSRVPPAHRESVIDAVNAMLDLFTVRQNAIYAAKKKGRKSDAQPAARSRPLRKGGLR